MALTDNLLHRWKLDEGTGTNAADSAGSRDGTLSSASDWNNDATYGWVYVSSQTNYIDLGTAQLAAADFTNLTVSFWCYPTTISADAQQFIMGLYDTGNNKRAFRFYVANDGDVGFQYTNDGTSTNLRTIIGSNTARLTTGSWQHILIRLSQVAAETPTQMAAWMYKDGSVASDINDAQATPEDIFANAGGGGDSFVLGADDTTPSTAFQGYLREICMWDRTISAAEVTDVYNENWGASTATPVTYVVTY